MRCFVNTAPRFVRGRGTRRVSWSDSCRYSNQSIKQVLCERQSWIWSSGGTMGQKGPEQKEWPSKVINSGPGCESVCTSPNNADNISEDVAVASPLVLIKITQTNVKICRNWPWTRFLFPVSYVYCHQYFTYPIKLLQGCTVQHAATNIPFPGKSPINSNHLKTVYLYNLQHYGNLHFKLRLRDCGYFHDSHET